MCVHPEALARVKNLTTHSDNHCHTPEFTSTHRQPSKAQWVVRNSSYYRPTKMNDAGEAET